LDTKERQSLHELRPPEHPPSPASQSAQPRRPRWRPGAGAGTRRDRRRAESASATPGAVGPARAGSRQAAGTAHAAPVRTAVKRAGARGPRPCGVRQPWARAHRWGAGAERGFVCAMLSDAACGRGEQRGEVRDNPRLQMIGWMDGKRGNSLRDPLKKIVKLYLSLEKFSGLQRRCSNFFGPSMPLPSV